MKIRCIGTGTMGSVKRENQSIMVDDILLDVGSGVVKKIEQLEIYTKSVNYLLITHVHADHFVDLPNYLIGRSIRGETTNLLYIICGKGIKEKVIQLFELCFGDGNKEKYENFEEKYHVKFIELTNGESFATDQMKITAYELEHGDCKPILGFTIEKDNKTVGYATDTTLCDNVRKICEKSDYAFLDATRMFSTKSHMGLEEVIALSEEYPNTKIYAIHRNDDVYKENVNVEFPNDGDIIEI